MTIFTVAAGLVVLAVAARTGLAVGRFVLASPEAKRNYPAAWWARLRWRWLSRNLGLAYIDQHRKSATRLRVPFGTSVPVTPVDLTAPARLRWPRARFRADDYGLVATVRTVPKVGRAEFDLAAPYLADAWRCHRVQVTQPRPGRLLVRGLRRDPLAEPLSMADAPAGVYGSSSEQTSLSRERSFRVYLGRDEWGADRFVPLANLTAAVVGGLPGTGKTTLANSLLCQLAPSPAVRLAIADGQGGADFASWQDRAYAYAGDDRADAAALFEDVHAEMRHRFATVYDRTGHRNAWHTGPTEAFPLLLLVVDEAHGYLDESLAKGDRLAEAQVRTCRAMLGQLVRRGRSVMVFTLLISQKPTSDAIPTFIRDNAGLRLCFAVQTVDAAVAVLGEPVRQYPALSPAGLTGPGMVGVLTVQLPTGGAPFTRLRVPDVSDETAIQAAAAVPAVGGGDLVLSPGHTFPPTR